MGKSRARKGNAKKVPSYATWSNPDRVEWDRLRRRSGAAGGHSGPRDRPRSTQRSEAIAASGRCSVKPLGKACPSQPRSWRLGYLADFQRARTRHAGRP